MQTIIKQNIFQLPPILPTADAEEIFEPLADSQQILIEKIISTGQITKADFWYEQVKEEWVLLLQGEASILFDHEDGQVIHLKAGDYIMIAAKRKHRVVSTSSAPPCIWLAVHGNLQKEKPTV